LLDTGVDVNRRYRHELTALMWAAGYGRTETVNELLAHGADKTFVDDRGKNALEIARDAGHKDAVALLRASSR
jgi:ankyrin repeat protein